MNRDEIRELLALHALGALEPGETEAVDRAVAADPALAAELRALTDTAHQLIAAAPAAIAPQNVRARLLASAAVPAAGAFDSFAARLARLVDVAADRAHELLGSLARPASWEDPVPGVHLVHFAGGPACAAADCGFVKIDPGGVFPWHMHRGEEATIVLSGALRTSDGKVVRAGEELTQPAGSEHDVSCEGDEPVIYVARVMNGIDLRQRP